MLIYVLIAIVVYLAVSQTLYPNLVSSQVTETSYSQFLEDVDNNKVVSAEIDTSNNEIKYTEGTAVPTPRRSRARTPASPSRTSQARTRPRSRSRRLSTSSRTPVSTTRSVPSAPVVLCS